MNQPVKSDIVPAELVTETASPPSASSGWEGINISSTPKKQELPPKEVTTKLVFDALRNGALGGFMIGSWASIAFELPYWETVLYGAFGSAMAFTLVTALVTVNARSRSIVASLLRLVYGTLAALYFLAFLGFIGLYIYVKTSPRPDPGRYSDPPRATIN
jgi:hypothetical protein